MEGLWNTHERRVKQRRKRRTGIKFPITDGSGCIVPFDRSCIADRRLENRKPGVATPATAADKPLSGYQQLRDFTTLDRLPPLLDSERDFCISGELIARVNNIYSSRSPGTWKELELYKTPKGQYLCLEVWRTTWDGKYDQYWMASCDDLKTAREFFGNNSLAGELFDEVSALLDRTLV